MDTLSEKSPILVVDDDAGLLLSIKATLLSNDLPEPDVLSDSRFAIEMIRKNAYKIVLLDLVMPHISGMELLGMIKKEFPETVCMIVTATDEVATAIQAIRMGAYDYLVKPVKSDNLVMIIQRAMERYNLRKEVALFSVNKSFSDIANPLAFAEIVAEDESMALIFRQIEAVAPTDYSVVITGESGTGKELMARMIHKLSRRASGPFVAVNMAAITHTLFESEFFGHTKGAYTHALSDRKGFFEVAENGTLFLDEITEMEPTLQGKLLRVIQEKEFYRLGSSSSKRINVRIIAATNKNIIEEVKNERFRADLFYRLSMYNIKIPPLRERKKDIMPLAKHFVRIYGKDKTVPVESISPELEQRLFNYSFPGNIRELENMIASAVLLEKSRILDLSSTSLNDLALPTPCINKETNESQMMTIEELEKQHIIRALKETGWDRKKAASILGINTATVYRKMARYGISDKLVS